MSDFRESAWADRWFAENYLDRADVYIVERRRLIWVVSSFFAHFFHDREGIRLLDLGCGDGLLTEELFKVNARLSATLIDGNDGMLQKAKKRLQRFQGVAFIQAAFQEILASSGEFGTFDIAVSSMAIHHLEKAEKAALFRWIAAHLNPGGYFVNIDMVLPPSEELEGWYFAIWKDWLTHMMNRYAITDESPDDLIRRYKDPSSMNVPDTLEDQLKALEAAGFQEADCYFKNGVFAVYGGKR